MSEKVGWLAVCDNGDAVMCNRVWSSSTGYDVILQRYAAADGATVWERRYGSTGTVGDEPRGMARDAAGDLLVAGARRSDFMALKFSRVDGSLLWSVDYNGPAASYDAANCVAEGPGGEVVVSGFTSSPTYSWNVTTIGLDPSSGSRLWASHYDGGGSGQSGEAKLLVPSAQGDLYVCGYFYGLDTDSDMMALRYQVGPPAGAEEAPGRPHRLEITPNPTSSTARIQVSVCRPGPVRIAVYDVSGRREAVLQDGTLAAGRYDFAWDGAPGFHLVRVDTPEGSVTRKIVRTR